MPKKINPTESEGVDGDLYEQLKADARGHVRNYGSWDKLSEVSGCAIQTISNFAYGLTDPQFRTVVRLMEAMGRGDDLRKAFYCDESVSTAEAQKAAPKAIQQKIKERKTALRLRKMKGKG